MSAREGLYANIFMCNDSGTVGPGSAIALLTGVELSWSQAKRRFYPLGSLIPVNVLDGVVAWEGRFRKAYTDNRYLGTLNVGTARFIGSIAPRGTTAPAIMGTIAMTGGNLSNMAAESDAPTVEEQGFILYNLSFFG